MGLFDSIKKFVDNIFGAIGDVLGYVLGIDTDLEDKYKGQLINKSSNIQKIPVIYGERLVGGTRVFVSTGGGKKNQYLYIALVLSEGEVDSIGDIYINDIISTDSRFTNKATIYKYRGTDNQAATTLFADADESWTSAHQLKGVAYLAMRFKYDQDVFTSIPEIRAVVKGKKVYNPATQITEWSDNPALCLRDYLTNPRYGKGLPASAIDDASIIQAASDCDSLVTPYGGATDIPLFKFNAIIDTGETVFDNVKKIIASMRGILPYSNGKYSLLVDKDQSSTFTLTEDNILSDIKIVSSSKENKFNQVTAKFPNPAKRWELDTVTYPDSGSTEETAFLNEDNQQILSKEITLHNVTNAYRAKDLARIACLASRRQSLTVSVTCTSEALNIAVGDIVTIEHDSLGWTGTAVQEFRVMGMVLDDSGEVDLTLQQYDASIYPWVEQSEIPDNPETTLPDPFTTAPVTNQSGTGQAVVQNDGTVTYFYDLEWDEPDDALVEYYLIDVNKTIDEVETLAAETLQTQNLNFRYMVSDTSIDYGFTIRAVNGAGTRSAGVTIPASSVIKDTTPPSVIDAQTTSVVAGLQSITVSWENPTEEDFDLVRIKVNDTNTEPTSHFAATRSDTFIHDIGEYSTIKYYWIAPVDTSGNVADYTFAGSATTGSIDYGDVLNPPTIPEVATTVYLTLSDSNAPTDAEFNAAVGRNPIENDFVVVNKEFAFVYDGSTWSAVTEFIDGSLLVSGSLSADDITTGTLNANDVTISNLTVSYDSQVSDKPDLSEFITAGEVNDNVTVIDGGIIQAGTAITVGTGDNVAVLSGSDATYRLWAGDATSADAPFKVSQTGVLYATGAEISGNITAGSIDAENITFTGSLIADGLSTIPNVEATNMTQSLRNAIEEIIVTKFGSDASTGYYDEATGSFDAQDDNSEVCRINTFQHNGSNIDIDVTFSRSWQASSGDIPSVEVNIQRSVAGANSWTTIKTQTITGSAFYEAELNNYFANIQGVVSITDNPTAGNYDYRFFTGNVLNLSLISINARLEANEQGEQIGTIDLANYAALAQDETITGNWTFSGSVSGISYDNLDNKPTIPDISTKANLSGATFTGKVTIDNANGWDGNNTGSNLLVLDGADGYPTLTFASDGTVNWSIYKGGAGSWVGDGSIGFVTHSGTEDATRVKFKIDTSGNITALGTITALGYNNSNWDTAYGWGDHSTQNYAVTTGDTFTGFITLSAGSGLYQYTENGAYINWDTRDSSLGGSATAMVHKWARKADDSGYATYYENWWDGNSYHSIGVNGNRWKLSDGLDVNGTITASGGTLTGNIVIESTSPAFVLRDTNGTGASQSGFISLKDSANSEKGWIGYGSTGDTDLTLRNSLGRVRANGTYFYADGYINTPYYQVNGTTVIDSSRNLYNINTLAVNGTRPASAQAHIQSTVQYALELEHNLNSTAGYYYDTLSLLNDTNVASNYTQIGFRTRDADGQHHRATILSRRDGSLTHGGELILRTRVSGGNPTDTLTLKSNGDVIVDRGNLQIGSLSLNSGDGRITKSTDSYDNLIIGSGNTALRFINNVGQKRIIPRDLDDTAENGTIDLGDSGSKFRDIHLSTGIVLSGTRVLDSSRNLANIGTINASGTITTRGQITVGDGETSSYIMMSDLDQGGRYIHCNSNRVGFLTSASGWGSWCNDDGSWESGSYISGTEYKVSGTTTIDSGRNLTNINRITQTSSTDCGIMHPRENTDGVPMQSGLVYFAYNHNSTVHPNTESEFDSFQRNNTTSHRTSGVHTNASAFTLSSDYYYAEFHGYLLVTTAGNYRFGVNADDAVDLYIDGVRVADDYGGHGAAAFYNDSSVTEIYLTVGYHKVFGRFEEVGGGDSCHFGWNGGSGTAISAIPSGNLFHDAQDSFKKFGGTTYGVGNLNIEGNITAYSDEKLKTNIKTIKNALSKVDKMRGVTYDRVNTGNRESGVIAQELEKVAPELVHDGEYKAVAYGNTVAYLIEAIKELKQEIEELKNGNNTN